jgi:DNA-binding transcriptional LysR family regulator
VLELRQLQYFLTVAERLSITEAARDLQMAQPALSQAITKMERRLGTALFDRSHRRLRLTAAGATLVPEARELLARAKVLQANLGRGGPERTYLRIGCIASAVSGLLPRVLPPFLAAHPETVPVVREMGQRAQASALRDGAIDVGICRVFAGDDGLDLVRLTDEPLHCLLPAGHRLAAGTAVDLGDLADDDVVCFPRDLAPVAHDAIISACVRAGFSPRITQEAGNDQSISGIVACGLAVAIVPESTTRLRIDGVVHRPLTDPLAVTPLSVVLSATAPSPIGTAFRDAVRAAA